MIESTKSPPARQVVLVEPICRGSRLQILANTLSALRGRADVILVTRRDYQSDHFHELVDAVGLTPRVVPVDTDLGGAWMRNLTEAEFALFTAALRRIEAECTGRYDLVFLALDDYLKAYTLAAVRLRKELPRADIRCVKYRVEYLFEVRPGARLRGLVLRAMTRWSLLASGARLIAFDERLAQRRPSYFGGLLPDPWFGPFSPTMKADGRALLGVGPDDFVMLSLGKQDRRKGIDFLIEAFPQAAQDAQVRLAVVGTIAAEFRAAFDELKRRFPRQVVHVNGFVPESALPNYFAAADAFLLPYSEDFTATSGTLARAAASGVPVLATEHGLVGYRVRTYGLGATFGARDEGSFVEALRRLRNQGPEGLEAMRTAGLQFAENCSLQRFEAAMRTALSIEPRLN
jgi:glycosyltransferase involved in cell wall biosynthesis